MRHGNQTLFLSYKRDMAMDNMLEHHSVDWDSDRYLCQKSDAAALEVT